jgi:hypothetical protein
LSIISESHKRLFSFSTRLSAVPKTNSGCLYVGFIYAGIPAKKVKELNTSDFAGEIDRISNNYVMYSSWFKED